MGQRSAPGNLRQRRPHRLVRTPPRARRDRAGTSTLLEYSHARGGDRRGDDAKRRKYKGKKRWQVIPEERCADVEVAVSEIAVVDAVPVLDIEDADERIAQLSDLIATNTADLKAATEIREKEASDFAKVEADLVDTVDILERAIGILEREMAKNPASSFAQVDWPLALALVHLVPLALARTGPCLVLAPGPGPGL